MSATLMSHHSKGVPLPASALEWFQLHFPESSFHGRYQLCTIGRKGFQVLWTAPRDKMEEFLKNMRVFSKSDYYLTANQFCGVKRQAVDLFALQNMVIDIDCHCEDLSYHQKQELLETFLWRYHRDLEDLPLFQTVVWTGRGIQLWWSIKAVHRDCKPYYDEVLSFFLHKISELLEEYRELEDLSVDTAASSNSMGLFRVPGTHNSKVHKEVRMEMTDAKPYILQDLVAFVKEQKQLEGLPLFYSSKQRTSKELHAVNFAGQYEQTERVVLKNLHNFSFFRLRQLIDLRKLRDYSKGEERRNDFSLLAYSALRAGRNHEEALEKLYHFNQGFKQPMSHSELEQVIYTAKHKEGYKYSNAKVIEFLNVSSEEQDQIALYPKDNSESKDRTSHASRDLCRKLLKEDRNEKIKQLFTKGNTDRTIATLLEISVGTVLSIVKPLRQEEKAKRVLQIQTLRSQGNTNKEIAKKLNISLSTIQRCKH